MIRSFKDKDTENIFHGTYARRFPHEIQRRARIKLRMIDSARELRDLYSPPGNRLEQLSGDRAGQHSIRINQQWRICFVWREGNACDVEIVDYH